MHAKSLTYGALEALGVEVLVEGLHPAVPGLDGEAAADTFGGEELIPVCRRVRPGQVRSGQDRTGQGSTGQGRAGHTDKIIPFIEKCCVTHKRSDTIQNVPF